MRRFTHTTLRIYLLSVLFFFYYLGIGFFSWSIAHQLTTNEMSIFLENKFFVGVLFLCFISGPLIFASSMFNVYEALRWYWFYRQYQEAGHVMRYIGINFVLSLLPSMLCLYANQFKELSTEVFYLGVTLVVVVLTYHRFNGLTDKELPS
jgi:hypothetical protein